MGKALSAAEARKNFSQVVTEAGYAGRETVIQRNNRPVAVVIGYEEYRELTALRKQVREREARFAIYDQIRARNPAAVPEQVEADIAEALRVVRGETE